MMVKHFRELRVYQSGKATAMKIFKLSKSWPAEERFSLTDQARRSSRAVCAHIAEAWRKRRYPAHFVSKLTDSDAEAAETQGWLDFALECGYITQEQYQELDAEYEKISGGLVKMMDDPDAWCGPSRVKEESEPYG